MGRRQRRRRRAEPDAPESDGTTDYVDADGNVLTLRDRVSAGTVHEIIGLRVRPAASGEDIWQRRGELLFERLAVRWTIAGLPLTKQSELLGRYRMADADMRRWVQETCLEHVRRHQPELVED